MKKRLFICLCLIWTLFNAFVFQSCIMPPSGPNTVVYVKPKDVFKRPPDMRNQVKIHINQVGYELSGPKRLVVETVKPATKFEVVDAYSKVSIYEGKLVSVQGFEEWGGGPYYQVADFSDVKESGKVIIRVDGYSSEIATISKDVLFKKTFDLVLKFFNDVRADTPQMLRAESRIKFWGTEKTDDVRGGWYDASGDTSKYLTHLSYANYVNPQQIPLAVWGLAWVHDRVASGFVNDASLKRIANEAAWGADYLLRVLDEEGYFYINVFDRWTGDLNQREICAFEEDGKKTNEWQAAFREGAGMSIAALARVSTWKVRGDFSSQKYLEGAKKAWHHLQASNLKYADDGKENVIDDYTALMAASELYFVTDDEQYIEAARIRVGQLSKRLHSKGYFIANDGKRPFWHASDAGLPVVALSRYVEVEKDESARMVAESAIKEHLNYFLNVTNEVSNPFGYGRQHFIFDGNVQSGFFIPHVNETNYWWQGENARLSSLAAAALIGGSTVYDDKDMNQLKRYAADQMNWILGSNPFDVCMLRGAAKENSTDYFPLPNNKGISDIDGGIDNGITGMGADGSGLAYWDMPGWEPDRWDSWRWIEQWLPHSAWYIVALTAATVPNPVIDDEENREPEMASDAKTVVKSASDNAPDVQTAELSEQNPVE